MDEIKVLSECPQISLVEINSILGDKEESVSKFCLQMFGDKSLDYFPLPLCDRTHDELLLTFCSEDRIIMVNIGRSFLLKNRSEKSTSMLDMGPKSLCVLAY